MSDLNHSGDCSIWIGPICDCGVLRRAISDGKTVLINGASAAAQWAAHLVAIDTQRHAFARMDDPGKPLPVKINLHESAGRSSTDRTIDDDIEAYKAMRPADKKLLAALVSKLIDLRCPHCHEPISVEIDC